LKLSQLALGTGLALGLAVAAQAQTTTLKIGYATNKESHYGVGSTVFCDEIEKGTQGRYKCQQFPSSALGGEREQIEAVQLGTQDLVNTSTGPVGNFVPEVKIVDIPFLSVGSLFVAGLLPGVLVAVAMCVVNWYVSKKRNYKGDGENPSMDEILRTTWKALPALLLPVVILGGMRAGWFTPTEASVVAVFYGKRLAKSS